MRLRFVAFTLVTIVAGLAVHWHGSALPLWLRDVTGDTLWATMMAWLVAVVAPRARRTRRAVVALGICWLVEASQLLHTPALDSIRATTVGRLTLGSDFDARDLAAYAVGIVMALAIETIVRRR